MECTAVSPHDFYSNDGAWISTTEGHEVPVFEKIPETGAIFENVHRLNAEADADPSCLRISLDTKATVAIGGFSRGDNKQCGAKALDHDFEPEVKLVPFGMLLPETGENYL